MTNDARTVHGRLRRRAFLRASLGSAAAGRAAAIDDGVTPQGRTYPTSREVLETPIVARHQVVIAGGGPSGVI